MSRAEDLVSILLEEDTSSTYPPKKLVRLAQDLHGFYSSTQTGYRDRNEPEHVFRFADESDATKFVASVKSKASSDTRWHATDPEFRLNEYYVSVTEWR